VETESKKWTSLAVSGNKWRDDKSLGLTVSGAILGEGDTNPLHKLVDEAASRRLNPRRKRVDGAMILPFSFGI